MPLQRFRHFFIDDALSQAFDDRGLSHSRLADQHRVVLGSALQDLDHPADFVVAADHRVEFANAGTLGQVKGVFLERFAASFRFLALHALAAAHCVDGLFERLAIDPVTLQQLAGFPLVVRQRQEKQLGGDELVAALLRFLVGEIQTGWSVRAKR